MKNKKKNRKNISPKAFIKMYGRFRIPWLYLILSGICALVSKEITLNLVPYQTKLMTGAITGGGFLLGYMLLHLAEGFTEIIQESVLDIAGLTTARNVRRSVWSKLIRLPMSYFGKQDSQELVSRITQDTTGVHAGLAIIIVLISTVFGVVSAFKRMFLTYDSLALIMLSGIPFMILFSWIVGKLQYRVITLQNNALAKMTAFFSERLSNIFHIKTSVTEDEEYLRGIEENNERYRAECRAERRFILIAPLSSLAQIINEIVLLIIASSLVRAGKMEMYQMVSLYNYYILFMSNAYMIMSMWQMIKSAHGASETIGRILDSEDENLKDGVRLPSDPEDICFRNVGFSYDEGSTVLRNVSFTIPKGKKTVIVGENGCGKSTVLKLIEKFENADMGSITFGNTELSEINTESLRDQIGYLFQGNQIVKGSIRENILYGVQREVSEEDIRSAAKKAQALDFILEKDEGFDTEISHSDNKVSGGEMQRIAAARMILKNPNYLIMDEALSGVDTVSEKSVLSELSEMMKDKTVIMVSHNIDDMKSADNIIVLKDGEVEAAGSFKDVYEHSELFREFADIK